MAVTFASWKIPPRLILDYLQHDQHDNFFNVDLAKRIVDGLVPENLISQEEAGKALAKEFSQMNEPLTRQFIMSVLQADDRVIKDLVDRHEVSTPFVLLTSVGLNQLVVAEWMLNNGTDINCSDPDGWTPLITACVHNHTTMINMLLNRRADVNQASKLGATPLHLAVANGNRTVVEELIQKGADLHHRMNDLSPLGLARKFQLFDMIDVLQSAGASE